MVFTSGTGSPAGSAVLTWASLAHTLLNLGPLGNVYMDPPTVLGIFDYYGIITGSPNPGAVTDAACNSLGLQFWINPGSVPPGIDGLHGGSQLGRECPAQHVVPHKREKTSLNSRRPLRSYLASPPVLSGLEEPEGARASLRASSSSFRTKAQAWFRSLREAASTSSKRVRAWLEFLRTQEASR